MAATPEEIAEALRLSRQLEEEREEAQEAGWTTGEPEVVHIIGSAPRCGTRQAYLGQEVHGAACCECFE